VIAVMKLSKAADISGLANLAVVAALRADKNFLMDMLEPDATESGSLFHRLLIHRGQECELELLDHIVNQNITLAFPSAIVGRTL
jgi:hypothetical protein